jgi:hypothetical protein
MDDTQAYVAVHPNAMILAFRGTEPTSLLDLATDIKMNQVPLNLSGVDWGLVHEGFKEDLQVILPKVLRALSEHSNSSRPLWITGHSLGGSLAILTAAVLSFVFDYSIAGVYTFGQMRVGNPLFRDRYNATLHSRTFRCVNNEDIIPHLPPREISRAQGFFINPIDLSNLLNLSNLFSNPQATVYKYEHVGQLHLLLPGGGLSTNPEDEIAKEPAYLKPPQNLLKIPRLLGDVSANAIKHLRNHAPIDPIGNNGYVERLEALAG